ncbi:MAG: fibronectin type III domain-containing protein [Acidobacteriota bacterium]
MPRTISRMKLGSQRPWGFLIRRRVQVVIAFGIVLSLFAAWTMLASSGALGSIFRQKGGKGRTVSTASFNSNSPSKEYVYAGGRLVATEEPVGSSGCGSPPPSPGNSLVATAQATTSVLLTWSASQGADHYEVERRANISDAWSPLSPNPTTNSFPDNGLVASTAYLYRVRAADAAGICPSAYSNIDMATTIIFEGDPLQSQLTIIRAQNVTQLRQAVDAVRVTANIGAATWTNPLDQVKAIHFSELRTKLNEALSLLALSQISNDPAIAQGLTVYATHLQAVRDKVK